MGENVREADNEPVSPTAGTVPPAAIHVAQPESVIATAPVACTPQQL
jgi:hypothetical protein